MSILRTGRPVADVLAEVRRIEDEMLEALLLLVPGRPMRGERVDARTGIQVGVLRNKDLEGRAESLWVDCLPDGTFAARRNSGDLEHARVSGPTMAVVHEALARAEAAGAPAWGGK